MDLWPKSRMASSFTILKGALIGESYAALAAWNPSGSQRANVAALRDSRFAGPRSSAWYRDVPAVISRRFDTGLLHRGLIELAKKGCPMDEWRPILLWHMTRNEFLLRDFLAAS